MNRSDVDKAVKFIKFFAEDHNYKVSVRIPEVGSEFYEVRFVMQDIRGGLVLTGTPNGVPRYWNILDVNGIQIEEA